MAEAHERILRSTTAPRGRGLWARRRRGLLGAGLLALVAFGAPGLSVAAAHGPRAPREWPTAPERGRGPSHAQVVVLAPHHEAHAHDWLVVEEPQPQTARQRRLLRRAERHAKKAEKLRAKSGVKAQAAYKVIHVPVAPARPLDVAVVHHTGCEHEEPPKIVLPQIVLPRLALAGVEEMAADVERQVEHALRGAERSLERAERARERAERAQQQAAKAQLRAGAALRREVDRALRDGVIDAEERRRISEAARAAARR
jgi:hypothetical protein